MIALVLAAVLSAGEKPAPRLSVTLPECGEAWLLTDSLMERLRLELAPLGINDVSTVPLSGEATFENDLLVIESPGCSTQAKLRLYLPPFTQVLRRDVALQGLSPLERARLLAFVVAELFAVSARDATAIPTGEVGVAELPPALLPKPPEAPVHPVRPLGFGFATVGTTGAPSVRVGLATLSVGGGYEVSSLVKLEGALRGSYGLNQTDVGGVETALVSGQVGASLFTATDADWLLSAGLQLQVGWLHVRGIAGAADVTELERTALALVPLAQISLEAPLGAHTALRATAEAGLVAIGLEARANGIPAGGLTGATVGISAGLSFR